jgi:hypothetical protein
MQLKKERKFEKSEKTKKLQKSYHIQRNGRLNVVNGSNYKNTKVFFDKNRNYEFNNTFLLKNGPG